MTGVDERIDKGGVSLTGGGSLRAVLARREVAFLALILICLAILALVSSSYTLYQINLVILASIGALALNLLTGVAGQVALGNAAFLGIGAFTVVLVTRTFEVGFLVSVPMAVIVSGIIGLAVGVPALRLKGLYLLLSTLALHYIFVFLATIYQTGAVGSSGFTIAPPSLFGWEPTSQVDWFLVIAPFGVASVIIGANLLHTRAGRNWTAIRYSETVAAGLGVPVKRYKVMVFVISSMMIGFQGAVTAYFLGFVASDVWGLNVAIAYVAMIILGGLGSITGSIIGAAIVTVLPMLISNFLATAEGLPEFVSSNPGPLTTFMYGLLIVVVLMVAPRGAMSLVRKAVARLDTGAGR